ncbi:MAG: hypothetical protein ACXVXC_06955 [Nocardioidaceae bacterium]
MSRSGPGRATMVTLGPRLQDRARKGVMGVTKMLIRVDGELTDEMLTAFPHLTTRVQRAHTMLTGDVVDQEELQGVLNFLSTMGITIVEVVTIPD